MIVQTVPFMPPFLIGAFFLLVPGFAVGFFTGNPIIGGAVNFLTAIAALVRPQGSWFLCTILCTLRTVPFLLAVALAFLMKLGGAPASDWLRLVPILLIGGLAHWRIRRLVAAGDLVI